MTLDCADDRCLLETVTNDCKKFHEPVDANFVCNDWEGKKISFPGAPEPSTTPGTESFGNVGDIGKLAAAQVGQDRGHGAALKPLAAPKLNASAGIVPPAQPLIPVQITVPQGPAGTAPPVMTPEQPVPSVVGQPKLQPAKLAAAMELGSAASSGCAIKPPIAGVPEPRRIIWRNTALINELSRLSRQLSQERRQKCSSQAYSSHRRPE